MCLHPCITSYIQNLLVYSVSLLYVCTWNIPTFLIFSLNASNSSYRRFKCIKSPLVMPACCADSELISTKAVQPQTGKCAAEMFQVEYAVTCVVVQFSFVFQYRETCWVPFSFFMQTFVTLWRQASSFYFGFYIAAVLHFYFSLQETEQKNNIKAKIHLKLHLFECVRYVSLKISIFIKTQRKFLRKFFYLVLFKQLPNEFCFCNFIICVFS